MALTPISLRVEAADGSAVEEYRIHGEGIEFRALPDAGEELKPERGDAQRDSEWYQLTPEQITMHVREKTAIAQWLLQRLGWQRLLRACTDPEMLHTLGVAEDTVDPYAA